MLAARNLRLIFLCVSIMLIPCAVSWGAGENIALGRSYTWTSAPNYSLCTDAGDVTQLTDGDTSQSYTQPGCVGWSGTGAVSITIDLGSVRAIEGFKVNPGSAHYLPVFVYMWVSPDNVTFTWAGELIAGSWPNGLPDGGALRGQATGSAYYIRHDQTLAGRYVKFTVFNSGYSFINELEVFAGDFDPSSVVPDPRWVNADFEQYAYDNKHDGIVRDDCLVAYRKSPPKPQHRGAIIPASAGMSECEAPVPALHVGRASHRNMGKAITVCGLVDDSKHGRIAVAVAAQQLTACGRPISKDHFKTSSYAPVTLDHVRSGQHDAVLGHNDACAKAHTVCH